MEAVKQRLDLVNEALHWLEQPEVRSDPVMRALAFRTSDILQEISLFEDTHLTELRENLRRLRCEVAEVNLKQVVACLTVLWQNWTWKEKAEKQKMGRDNGALLRGCLSHHCQPCCDSEPSSVHA